MINYAQELNKEQLKVVQNGDGPCLVLAGAGSGKTRTITYRVAYLIEKGVDPKNILLVTFTNKAAKEMISRVKSLTGGEVGLPWSGTFHHVAYRWLKKYAPLLGYQTNFSVLDSDDSNDLIKLCLKQEGVDRTQKRFPSAKVIQAIISYARNAEQSLTDVLQTKHPNWAHLSGTIGRIAEDYRRRKLTANVMDFDDLLVNLRALLTQSQKVRELYAKQFQYILVDEYQDTNKVQASIIELLASYHHNILVVGDDAQSIYSFRAADIQNILDFEKKHQKAKVFRLETNYRSTPDILKLANDVIANNVHQYEKELKSVRDNFTKPEVHAFADQSEEAEFVAERILELRDEGVDLNKMAVLFRASFHSQALEVELVKRDIPYEYRGGVRFFERSHIKDVLAYLRIFNNQSDAIAWSRVLNMQAGIGPATVEKIISEVHKSEDLVQTSLSESLSARAQIGWNDFLSVWQAMKKTDGTPSELISAVLESKYGEYLEYEYQDARERKQDLEQLAIFAEHQKDLAAFLAEASMQESYNQAQTRSAYDEDEKLILSTVHQAKGLEWEAVFVLNLSAGQFPNDRAMREANGLEEERRLFYVAITRAKKYLYLTYPLSGGFSSFLQGPSIFLEELDRSLISESGLGAGTVWSDPSDDVDEIVYEALDDDKPFGSAQDKPFGSSASKSVTNFLKGLDEL